LRPRHVKGNITLLGIVCLLLVLGAAVTVTTLGLVTSIYENDSSAVDAAALAAASDISRIIMTDTNYGFVSLSPCPPIGKATVAADGQPTEVSGINAIIAANRLAVLVAHKLQSRELMDLADYDWARQRETTKALNRYLQSALLNSSTKFFAADGTVVKPYEHVKEILYKNLRDRVKNQNQDFEIKNLRLTLGWSQAYMPSGTSVPGDCMEAELPPAALLAGSYRAFYKIPACGRVFYFAATPPRSAIVDSKYFRSLESEIPCSIVKVECDILVHNHDEKSGTGGVLEKLLPDRLIHHAACASAFARENVGPRDVLSVCLRGGIPDGISCLADFLNVSPDPVSVTNISTSTQGDYLVDENAQIENSMLVVGGQQPRPCQIFADAIYTWLKHVGASVKLNSVIAVMKEPFIMALPDHSIASNFTFEVSPTGRASLYYRPHEPFKQDIRSECQTYGYCPFEISASGQALLAIVKNNCSKVGITNGGKHAGQPVDAIAANWRELSYYSGTVESAAAIMAGGLSSHATIQGMEALNIYRAPIPNSISPASAVFLTSAGKKLENYPRTTFYCGGEIANITVLPSNSSPGHHM